MSRKRGGRCQAARRARALTQIKCNWLSFRRADQIAVHPTRRVVVFLHGLYGGAIEHVMPGRLLKGNLADASVFQNADVQKYRALISATLRFSGIDGRLVPI